MLIAPLGLALGLPGCGGEPGPEGRGAEGVSEPTNTVGLALTAKPTTAPPPRMLTAAVGALPGSGSVGFDGAYHYRIPIEVPPGRGGMAPSLALAYSSKAGNGPVGVGFRLEGPSRISRCNKVPAAGGVRDRMTFITTDDVYCLDGQRLVFVAGTATHGNVGAQYRTELDSFTRIKIAAKSGNAITKWTAETKDGRMRIYEVLADTVDTSNPPQPWAQRQKVNADGSANGAATPVHLFWPLIKEHDRSGNGMRYGYKRSGNTVNDGGGDEPLLSQVDYTTCEVTPCDFADSVRPRRVTLNYEPRPSEDFLLERWVNGVVLKTRVRLRDIATQVRNDAGTWVTQRTYTLSYHTDSQDPTKLRITKRSLLEKVQLCEGTAIDGVNVVCLTPTSFEWQSRGQHQVRIPSTAAGSEFGMFVGTMSGPSKMETVVFDANGDGNDDILLHRPSQVANSTNGLFPANTTYKEQIALGDGAGGFKAALDVNWNAGACKALSHIGATQPVDLDGNGRTELVIECAGNYRVLAWDANAGTLSEVAVPGITDVVLPARPTGTGFFEGYVKFADFTGDGRPEMLTAGPGVGNPEPFSRWYRKTAQSATLSPAFAPQVSYGSSATTALRVVSPPAPNGFDVPQVTAVLDLDGDGHQELVQVDFASKMRSYEDPPDGGMAHSYRFHDVDNNVKWVTDREEAAEPLSGSTNWGAASFGGGSAGQSLWYFADVNGDGLKDALYTTNLNAPSPPFERFSLRVNTGEGFLAPVDLDLNRCKPNWVGPKGSSRNLLIADMNGDGRDDLVKLSGAVDFPSPNWSAYNGTNDPIRVCYSNGVGFDAPIDLPLAADSYRLFINSIPLDIPNGSGSIATDRFPMTEAGDFNGDGIAEVLDFVIRTTAGFQGLRTPVTTQFDPVALRGGVDLMIKVSDSRGVRQTVTYDSLSAGTVGRLGLGALADPQLRDTHVPSAGSYPTASVRKGAVVRLLSDLGHTTPGRDSYMLHLYEGGRISMTGRDFIGFNRRYTIEGATGEVTRYDFNIIGDGSSSYYQYPRATRPNRVQVRDTFAPVTELGLLFITRPPAATGVVSAPTTELEELYVGHPLRLDSANETQYVRTRKDGAAIVDTGSNTQRQTRYDTFGNLTDSRTDASDPSDPAFTAMYARQVTTRFDNTVNDTTWRIGEARRIVETTSSFNPYRFGGDVNDTRTTEFWYDAKGRLEWVVREPNTSPTAPAGTNGELAMTRYTRNNAGQVTIERRYSPTGVACANNAACGSGQECTTAATGAVGQCWTTRAEAFGYDISGSLIEMFGNAIGQTRWVLHDSLTLLPYVSADENGVETVTSRDGLGRVRKTDSAVGPATTITYARDANNGSPFDIVRTSDETGARSSRFMDSRGRERYRSWSTFSGGSGVSDASFDILGNVTRTRYKSSSSTEAAVSTTVATISQAVNAGIVSAQASYDSAGRPISKTRGTTEQSTFTYPAYGKTAVSDGEGLSSSTTVDAMGRVVVRTQGAHEIHYRYKGEGPLASIAGTDDHTERFYFDKLGRKTQWTTGVLDNATERLGAITYDAFDRMVAFSRDRVAVTQTFDDLDRVTKRASGTEVYRYVWGASAGSNGRLKRAYLEDLSHDVVNTYDTQGQLTERREKFANGATLLSFGYEYDSFGRLLRLRYPEGASSGDVSAATHQSRTGPTVQYNYQNGQLLSLTEVASGNPILWRADTRHVHGMTTAATYGSPTSTNRLTATWGYYDDTLRLRSHDVARTTADPTPGQTYVYSNNGRLESRTATPLSESYTYAGALGFLETYQRAGAAGQQLVNATFSYDDMGMTGVRHHRLNRLERLGNGRRNHDPGAG